MAVEQEMADVHPPEAEDISELLPETDCGNCGFPSCVQFAEAILEREISPHKCTELEDEFANIFGAIVELNKDPIPYNLMMRSEEHTSELQSH